MPAGNRSGIHHERCRHAATVGNAQAYDRSYTYDQAGRLTTVADRTATVAMGSLTPDTTASAAAPCQVRSYGFNSDGARTSCGVENHSDGDCTSTTAGTVTTATTAYHVDTADRFTTAATTGGSTGAGYGYDGLGRQTSIPAADTPAGAGAGDLSLGYYVDDLPGSVSQHGVTSTFILDAAGRRVTQTVTGGADDGTTITGHYTDTSDNPGWETTTPAGGGTGGGSTLTRFTDSLDGALGAMITGTGEARIPLVDPHGNNVTSITIPSGVSTSQACTGIDAWNSYTEYGTPSAGTTPSGTVTGPLGYGWVGAHQRATGPDTAGLTLMGVRYYNPVTGAFASPDPIPGGNNTSYGYPGDPINTTDLTGQCLSGFGWACRSVKRLRGFAHYAKKAVVNVAAVPPYLVYLGAYKLKRTPFGHSGINRAILGGIERVGLHADVLIDQYKMVHNLGENDWADEGRGTRFYADPLHTFRSGNWFSRIYWTGLPGVHRGRYGRAIWDY